MLRKLLFLSFLLVWSFNVSFSQTPPLLRDASIVLKAASTAGYFKGTFEIVVADTINIDQLELNLGSDADSSNLVFAVVDFDIPNGQPTGMHYSRFGNKIFITTDIFQKHFTYFGSVRAKSLSGTWEDSQRFVAN